MLKYAKFMIPNALKKRIDFMLARLPAIGCPF
jgi:hypothetical protein